MLYLLSELRQWQSSGRMGEHEASQLRTIYEGRRDSLRRELLARGDEKLKRRGASESGDARTPFTQTGAAQQGKPQGGQPQPSGREGQFVAFPVRRQSSPPPISTAPPTPQRPKRTLLERLADPQTLRLLLYTGAAMLVVGVVIWLRDLLYLKLQEPIVQAGLLALGTAAFIISGWYAILRTRQRWTGRALTLAGSLLVPVNFWFLVRSGLVANQGRGWVVCAFCALLYAYTAAMLRERLYVYMASGAMVATIWALILRDAPRAFGLYALSLTAASLLFLHLARLFPVTQHDAEEMETDPERAPAGSSTKRWDRELWGVPLERAALVLTTLSLLIYMPLRLFGGAPSFYDGIFRLRSSAYDASIAILILAAAAYTLWFAGRYVYLRWSALFYTTSSLIFFLLVWVTCDGLRLQARATLFTLSLVTLLVALAARALRNDSLSQPLHHSSLLVCLLLSIAGIPVLFSGEPLTASLSASLALVAASFAALGAPRFGYGLKQTALAHLSALYFSISYSVALASASLESEALNTLLCAAWPLALYAAAEFFLAFKRETHLSGPFTRVADVSAFLLLLWGGLLAFFIHASGGGASRGSSIAALAGVVLYGALRSARSGSAYAMGLGTLASVFLTAALLDALRMRGLWPNAWPIAAGTVVFAFLMERGGARLFRPAAETQSGAARPLLTALRIVLDSAVVVCAIIWLVTAFTRTGTGSFAAASVLLLTLLYWVTRTSENHAPWSVRIASGHASAFLIALFIALRARAEWLVLMFTLTGFPAFFILSRQARAPLWLREPMRQAAGAAISLSLLVALVQALPYLRAGNQHLLAPSLAVGAVALLCFAASIFTRGRESLLYFRAGLWAAVVSIMLASLRSGFDPIEDVEVYSTPIAVLLLVIAYLSLRRAWAEYDRDAGALLWVGSVLLCAPLLMRSLEFRLLLDIAAPWRDVAVLAASLMLIIYGVVGRMRAPVLTGSASLLAELSVITLTSVQWLQVPLKYYLMTVGALLLVIFGTLEYRREQFMLMRKRLQERRDSVRERFGEWR